MAVGYDTGAGNGWGGGTTCDVTLTVAANSNRALTAKVSIDATASLSSVAYTSGSGDAWTSVGSQVSGDRKTYIYRSTNPSSGSVTVRFTFSLTFSGNFGRCRVDSYYNVDQTTPCDGFASGGTVTSLAVTSAVGDAAVLVTAANTDIGTVTPGTTDETGTFYKMHRADGEATVTFTWTNGSRSVSGCNINAATGTVGPLIGGKLVGGGTLMRGRLIG